MTTKIIICNQQLSINQLNTVLESFQPNEKVVCSIHAFFDRETESLSQSAKENCRFYIFADFFSDQELWDIDNFSLKRTKEKQPLSGRGGFNQFKTEMIERKSFLLYEKLCQKFGDIELFVVDGLGISADWWKGVGAKKIDFSCKKTLFSNVDKILRKIVGVWLASSNWREVFCQNLHLVLFSKITRISNKLIANSKPVPIWKRLVIILSNKRIFPYKKNVMPACTLHELFRLKMPMLIFQDGHFPSNYSAGHLWEYEDYYSFVPCNPIGEKWLSSSGVKVCKLVDFHDPLMKKVDAVPSKIVNILFALNHAGDWSAMINRSDTCLIVKAAKLIAKSNENFRVRIRPHPGMSHIAHEGLDSFKRIVDEVQSWGIYSVEISSESLLNDMEWSDVVISEYSQVLIDSWTMGKLGVSLNLTQRRSFMQDYNELGFINADSIDSLIAILKQPLRRLIEQHNTAVGIFNEKIINWKL